MTLPVVANLGERDALPPVLGDDDARRAMWVRADSYADLVGWLRREYGGEVFAAHVRMLRDLLDPDAG